jgi:hypothetical protein
LGVARIVFRPYRRIPMGCGLDTDFALADRGLVHLLGDCKSVPHTPLSATKMGFRSAVMCSWRVLWAEARLKGEDKCVFMFSGKGTIFIFGKKYLTDEQQKEIRRLAALS